MIYFYFNMYANPQGLDKNESPSLLDLIFTNEPDMINNLSYLPPLGNSDHICIEFNLMCVIWSKRSLIMLSTI